MALRHHPSHFSGSDCNLPESLKVVLDQIGLSSSPAATLHIRRDRPGKRLQRRAANQDQSGSLQPVSIELETESILRGRVVADGSVTDKGRRADEMPSRWSAEPLGVGLPEKWLQPQATPSTGNQRQPSYLHNSLLGHL